jgi:4'-phosphopantetheinyl transferase
MLQDRFAHLWHLDPTEIRDPRLLAEYSRLLSPEESSRQARFVFAKDRHTDLVSRALVRATLSRYTGIDPRDWVFHRNEAGRPEVVGPPNALPLHFNLSHTDGMVVCAITDQSSIGVDVENREVAGEKLDLADHYFATSEVAALSSLPPTQRPGRFVDLWTLKESYLKARGLGLSVPLDQVTFRLPPEGPLQVSFGPEIQDDPAHWQFGLFNPGSSHRIAVAVRRGDGPDLEIELSETLPLVS